MTPKHVKAGKVQFGNNLPFVLLAGPCLLESRDHAMEMASALKELTTKLDIPFVYKTSFDKANRTSMAGARGVGLKNAQNIFDEIRTTFDCPLVTDVHSPEHCDQIKDHVDILQIPAFLCRQTDLLLAAGNTGKAINVKKGQFLAPWDMANVVKKIESTGNHNILLCERGVCFGYNRLVVDMRSLPIMAQTGYPTVFDATHAVQEPGGQGESTGGKREFAPILARAAVAIGVGAVFIETHQDPDHAPSDGPNMIRLKDMEWVLRELKELDHFAKKNPIKL
ncbi:MAG: 3-deoxy-8-phosphooctulonate synthase [Alphaproteobacteria bacterium]